jgi:broad specificity phosphatase PhoE
MLITFIRHSKTIPDPDVSILQWVLSEKGVELAKDLSQKEEVKNLAVIYSSLQTKALETALILAKPQFIPIKTDNNLTETTSLTNTFEPRIERYEEDLHLYYDRKLDRLHNGETIDEALARFNSCLEKIAAAERDKNNIGIVSHGSILAFFAAQYTNLNALDIHKKIRMPDLAIFDYNSKKFLKFFSE